MFVSSQVWRFCARDIYYIQRYFKGCLKVANVSGGRGFLQLQAVLLWIQELWVAIQKDVLVMLRICEVQIRKFNILSIWILKFYQTIPEGEIESCRCLLKQKQLLFLVAII